MAEIIVSFVSLMIVINIFPAIHIDSWVTGLIAVLVLGLINLLLRPVIILLTLPINIFSLGLFTFVINGAMFYLASAIVPGFKIAGFFWAVAGSLVYGLLNLVLKAIFVQGKPGSGLHFTYPKTNKYRDVIDVEAEEDTRQIGEKH